MIHEAVGIGVVGLSHVSGNGRNRGKENEKVQRFVFGGRIHVKGSEHLWGHHGGQVVNRLVDNEIVPNDPRAMNNTVYAVEPGACLGDEGVGRLLSGYIRLNVDHFRTQAPQGFYF